MKLMLYILNLLLPLALWGQDSTANYPKNQLTFNTFMLVDLFSPGLELGYERKVNDHITIHVAAAKLANLIVKPYDKFDGYRFTCEFRYIHKMHFKNVFIVPSVSFVRNEMKMTKVGVFARDTGINSSKWIYGTYRDTFSMQKAIWAVNANGSVLMPYHAFAFEYILGLGIKNRIVTHTDRLYPGDPFKPNRHNSEADAYLRTGAYYTFSMAMTLRVSYCF